MAAASEFENHCWKDIIDEELVEIYQSYQRETFVGESPAAPMYLKSSRPDDLSNFI